MTLTKEVASSCGGRLTLRDGQIATDVLYERQMAKQAADHALDMEGICAKCLTRKVKTTADDESTNGKKLTRIEETCPRCHQRTTHWEAR